MTPDDLLHEHIKSLSDEIYAYTLSVQKRLEALEEKYSPNQPRVPRGNPNGGEWTDAGSGNPSSGTNSPHVPGRGRFGESDRVLNNPSPLSRTVSGGTPRVTERSPTKVSIHRSHGQTETRVGGSRAWRNNNPGNIRAGEFANRHGAIGRAGGFAVFPDEATGQAASGALLKTPAYADLTINEAIARRSPSNENDTSNVQNMVNRIGGFSGHEKIRDLDPQQFSRLQTAIQRTEGWRAGTILHETAR